MILDRIKASISRLARNSSPGLDYLALYRAKVNAQSADGKTLDVTPDDSRIPPMAAIPLRHGLPGLTAKVTPGGYVLVGWWNGDPSKPYTSLWEGGETVTKLVVEALEIHMGGETGSKKLATEDHTHTFSVNPGTAPTVTITTNPPIPAGLTTILKGK